MKQKGSSNQYQSNLKQQ